uniref:Uncharacterized protein n=1 Tax=Micrurus spixii TaxID=129469 RepID=A0A2D4NHA1_9SAUR
MRHSLQLTYNIAMSCRMGSHHYWHSSELYKARDLAESNQLGLIWCSVSQHHTQMPTFWLFYHISGEERDDNVSDLEPFTSFLPGTCALSAVCFGALLSFA